MIDNVVWSEILTRNDAERARAAYIAGILGGYRGYLYDYCEAADELDELEQEAPGAYHSPTFKPAEEARFKSAPGYIPPATYGEYYERIEELEERKKRAAAMMEACHEVIREMDPEDADIACEIYDLGVSLRDAADRRFMSKSTLHRHMQECLKTGRVPYI